MASLYRRLRDDQRGLMAGTDTPLVSMSIGTEPRGGVPIRAVDEEADGDGGRGLVLRAETLNGSCDVSLPLADLREALSAQTSALDIAAFALAKCRAPVPGEPWRAHVIGRAKPPSYQDLGAMLSDLSILGRDDEISRHLDSGRSVLLYGPIGAGKTTGARRQAYRALGSDHAVIWLDLTDPNDGDESVARALLESPRCAKILIVMDNLQANRPSAVAVFDLVSWLKQELGLDIVVLATALTNLPDIDRTLSSTCVRMAARGEDVIDAMLGSRNMPAQDDLKLRSLARENAFMAKTALDIYVDNGAVPEAAQFNAQMAAHMKLDQVTDEARTLLYELASLALVEIEVSQRYAAKIHRRAILDQLVKLGLVELNDESYSIGHRTRALIIVEYARKHWQSGAALEAPNQIAYNYLQRADSRQIKATLDKIDMVPARARGPEGTAEWIAGAWQGLDSLGRRLEQSVRKDPTWDDETASAIFANRALKRLDLEQAWQKTAAYIRGRWSVAQQEAPIWNGTPPADLAWFVGLRESMRAEDAARRAANVPPHPLLAEDFDPELACRTWMLGALLYFEASAIDRNPEQVDRLIRLAGEVLDRDGDGSGAFYPGRLPWITAQMVLGLCEAGLSKADPLVRSACDWLRRRESLGGPFNYFWESGSGDWVSPHVTTALCINALLKAGYTANDPCVRSGYAYLRAEKTFWSGEGREMDLALVVEATLREGAGWRDFSSDIMDLVQWALRAGAWHRGNGGAASRTVLPGANSKTPFIAAQLADMVWTALRRELPQLLHALSGLDGTGLVGAAGNDAAEDPGTAAAPSADPDPDEPPQQWASATLTAAADRGLDRILSRIDSEIDTGVRVRADLKRDANKQTITEHVAAWQVRRGLANQLHADRTAGITEEYLRRLDELGRQVLGEGWDNLADM